MKKIIKLFIFATLFVSFTGLKPMYHPEESDSYSKCFDSDESDSYEETNTLCIPIPQRQIASSFLDTEIIYYTEKETLYLNGLPNNLPPEIICNIFEQLIRNYIVNQPKNILATIDEINNINLDGLVDIIVFTINDLINDTSFLNNLNIVYSISNLTEKYNLDEEELAQKIINSLYLKIKNKSTENLLFEIIMEYNVNITDEFIEKHYFNDYYELSDDFYNLIINRKNIS